MKQKKQKQTIRRFVTELLSNMSFMDRIRFAFSGNYVKPLNATMKRYKIADGTFTRPEPANTGKTPEEPEVEPQRS